MQIPPDPRQFQREQDYCRVCEYPMKRLKGSGLYVCDNERCEIRLRPYRKEKDGTLVPADLDDF